MIPEDETGKGEKRAASAVRIPGSGQRDREKVREAKRPVINAGNGIRIRKAFDVFQRVVEMLGIPVVTGWNSLDCMYDSHPLWAGRAIWATVPETLPYRTVIFSCPWEAVFPSARWGCNYPTWAREAYVIYNDIDAEELKSPQSMWICQSMPM